MRATLSAVAWVDEERIAHVVLGRARAPRPRAAGSDRAPSPRCPRRTRRVRSSSHSTSIRRSLVSPASASAFDAVLPVDRDAAAAGDEADDRVARHRRAAPREPHHDVVEALDVDPGRAGTTVRSGAAAGAPSSAAALSSPPRSVALRGAGRRLRAETWPSPIAAYRRVEVGVAERRRRLGEQGGRARRASAPGRPSRRSALTSSSRPLSMASSRRSRENHWRILLRARGETTIFSQSWRRPGRRRSSR